MKGVLILLVLLLAVVAAFAVQNPGVITVRFLNFTWPTSLLAVIVAAFGAGVLAGWLAILPGYFRRRSGISTANKRIRELEIEVAALKTKPTPPAGPAQKGST
ncbi:MAG TPA: LapA family protein [Candidatus Deferrimicrobiaceae bacterium]